jgi:hypothetical protein
VFAVAALVVGVLPGCVTDLVDPMELPDAKIAVRLWDSESGRQRRDLMDELAGKPGQKRREGVLDLGNLSPRAAALSAGGPANPATRYPGRLALIDPRSREIEIVEEAPPGARPLSWSPDRSRLLYSSDRQGGRLRLFELNFTTREVRPVAVGPENKLAGAHLGDDGYAYAVVQLDEEGAYDLQIRRTVSRGPDDVVDEGVAVRHFATSRDGRFVVYAPYRPEELARFADRHPRIVAHDLESGSRRELAPGLHPVVTPDGQWVVYSARSGDAERTVRIRVDGSGRTAVGPSVRNEETPAVSPDGRYVVYVSEHNGLDRLFVKRFDGSGDRLLFDDAAVEWPIW